MRTVIETPLFESLWPSYWSPDEYAAFITFIASHPHAGDVVPGTNGVRKVRWKRQGIGKSGGVRVIYFARSTAFEIVLLTLYAKANVTNLSSATLKEMRRVYD
ncbi:transcriptional regulator [Duganella sp. Leaf126]|uniref:transcriptional regulator n=1 Tax=Duganella sp. Leaf126 TaxID=1736266 RepID=UPI000700049A|nr:transcriptional regulator [Duganella sp. Leaf126]KQQ32772.1 transcriptional regulator [Duganella sp. Leaf126]